MSSKWAWYWRQERTFSVEHFSTFLLHPLFLRYTNNKIIFDAKKKKTERSYKPDAMQYILGQCRCWIERRGKKKTETIVKMRPTYSFFFSFIIIEWMRSAEWRTAEKKTLDQGLLRMWLKHILWADIFSCLSSFRRRFHNKMCVSQICVRGFHHVFLFLICLFTCIHLWWMQAEKKCLGAKRIDGPGQFGLLRDFFFVRCLIWSRVDSSFFSMFANSAVFSSSDFVVISVSDFMWFVYLQCSIVLHHVGKELFAVVGRTRRW